MIFDTYSCRKQIYCAETAVIKYDLCYPIIRSSPRCDMLNGFNKRFIDTVIADSAQKLYKEAVKQYKTLVTYNSFTPFDVKNNFNIMLSNNKILSIFWDFYINKGASGFVMYRVSHNWSLDKAKMLMMKDIFSPNIDWETELINHLKQEVASFEKEMGISCFLGWEDVLRRSIECNKYYITDNGLVIYCLQGSIASNLWGIPSFLAPFSEIKHILDKKFSESLH